VATGPSEQGLISEPRRPLGALEQWQSNDGAGAGARVINPRGRRRNGPGGPLGARSGRQRAWSWTGLASINRAT